MLLLLLTFVGSGLLLIVLGVPLIRKQVPPNRWYGVRIRRVMANPTIWYAVNAFTGKRLLVTGLCTALAAFALYFVPGLKFYEYSLACSGVLTISLAISLIQTVQYLKGL